MRCYDRGAMNVSLYQAGSAMNANSRWQEMIAQNLASSSIPGYRKQEVVFNSIPVGSTGVQSPGSIGTFSVPQASSAINFVQGEMRFTDLPTDIAIEGNAFFEVQLPDGTMAYTRDGEFQINAQGQLVTKQGFLVMTDGGRGQSLDRLISSEADADLAQTLVKLNTLQTAYQAALQSGGSILGQSLLDFLR